MPHNAIWKTASAFWPFVIMVFLAPLLCIFEGLISRTTIHWHLEKEGEHVVS